MSEYFQVFTASMYIMTHAIATDIAACTHVSCLKFSILLGERHIP